MNGWFKLNPQTGLWEPIREKSGHEQTSQPRARRVVYRTDWLLLFFVAVISFQLGKDSRPNKAAEVYVPGLTDFRSAVIVPSGPPPAYIPSLSGSKDPDAFAGNRDIARALVYQLERGETENMLAYQRYDGGGVQAVFVRGGRRYTVYWSGKPSAGPGFLSFWVRPNGTSDRDKLVTFTDEGVTGAISFGIGPGESAEERRFYQSIQFSGMPAPTEPDHEEFFEFWQSRYFTALGDAEATILDF